jgi:type III pantothenate kinase
MAFLWYLPVTDILNTKVLNLVIDVGNSTIKGAIFTADGHIKSTCRFADPTVEDLRRWAAPFSIEKAILSASGKVSDCVQGFLSDFKYIIFSDDLTLPISINYNDPSRIGKDRIAGAVAVWRRFPDKNNLYVDMGTCITYNLVRKSGEFDGGLISPGIKMRLDAMHRFTQALPEVSVEGIPDFPVFETKQAMRAGAVQGAIFEIEQFILSFQNKYEINNVIITGGDAYIFEKSSNFEIFVLPNLVLEGLNEILEYNAQ